MEIPTTFLVLVPVVVGVVEAFKQGFDISSRYAPLLSIVFGVAGVCAVSLSFSGLLVLEGVIVGLSAAGLYSGAKKTFTNS